MCTYTGECPPGKKKTLCAKEKVKEGWGIVGHVLNLGGFRHQSNLAVSYVLFFALSYLSAQPTSQAGFSSRFVTLPRFIR